MPDRASWAPDSPLRKLAKGEGHDLENWQLALIILGAVFIGALIPVFILLSLALYRAGREIAEMGRQLGPTLMQIQVISNRVETMSRGLDGGEKRVADFLAALGVLTRGLERNVQLINVSSAILAAIGPAAAAFVKTMKSNDRKDTQ